MIEIEFRELSTKKKKNKSNGVQILKVGVLWILKFFQILFLSCLVRNLFFANSSLIVSFSMCSLMLLQDIFAVIYSI